MAKEKASDKDLRALLADAAEASSDEITEMLKASVSQEKLVWAYCPDCHKKVRVDYPDYTNATRLLSLWLDQGFGKTGTGSPGKVSEGGGKKPEFGKPLEKMTAEERDAYAAALLREHPELKDKFALIKADAIAAVKK